MANTATTVPANMMRAVSSSRSALRGSAPNFQFRTTTPSAASILAVDQAASHTGSQADAPTNGNKPGARQQGHLPAGNSSQSNAYNTSNSNEQTKNADEPESNPINRRTTACQSRSPGVSLFQTEAYHKSAEKYWPNEKITFRPSSAYFAVGMLACRHMINRIGTLQEKDPMPSGNQLFDMYKIGDLRAAQQPVVCTDNSCQCGLAIHTLQHKLELQQEEVRQDGIARGQLVEQCTKLHSAWESSVLRAAALESELNTIKHERDRVGERNSTLQRHNEILLQQNQELNQKLNNIEEQKGMEQRKKVITEEMRRQIAESQALAAKEAANQNAGGQMTVQTQDGQTSQPSASATIPDEAVLQGKTQENSEPSTAATPAESTLPTTPNSLKVQFTHLPDGGLAF
ncbi:hypothetical protein DL98DRAFT_580388 [Cadophora sp. DSE1049]|nr:hypothetical protein DL98DRAFT_580388 [Cadophora sp. DSE1049]